MDRSFFFAVFVWWFITTVDWAVDFKWNDVKVNAQPAKVEKIEKKDDNEIKPTW